MTEHFLLIGSRSKITESLYNLLKDLKIKITVISRKKPRFIKKNDFYSFNLININKISSLYNKIEKIKGEISSIVFCFRYREKNLSNKKILQSFTVNVLSTIYFLENLVKKKNKTAVIVTSEAAIRITKTQHLEYHLSKSSLETVAKYFAVNYAKYNVRVNCIRPSHFLKNGKSKKISEVPLLRSGDPKELSNLIYFLCSKKSSYITGECISIDGGKNLQC